MSFSFILPSTLLFRATRWQALQKKFRLNLIHGLKSFVPPEKFLKPNV